MKKSSRQVNAEMVVGWPLELLTFETWSVSFVTAPQMRVRVQYMVEDMRR
jgi:hypothetical protein